MKKSSRYIVICITALFLSICIPIVSFAKDIVDVYETGTITLQGTYTTAKYYSPSDSTSDFPPTFYNYYVDLGDYNDGYYMVQGSSSYSFILNKNFTVPDNYNSIDFIFINANFSNSNAIEVRFKVVGNNTEFYQSLNTSFFRNQSFPKTFDGVIWDRTLIYIAGPTGDLPAYKVSLYSDTPFQYFNTSLQWWSMSGYYLVPTYKMHYNAVTYTEWEKEQKQMHEQTLNEISQIGDDVSRVGDEVSRVGNEVSKVGEEISQFHNDLTSLPSDFNESSYQGVIDDVSSSVSDITSYEGIINDAIESNASDVANFDVSDLESYVEDGLTPLTNDTEDIAFESFLKNMYDSLGMATYFIVFAPFAIIFVLFKFVIGGIT